MSARESPRRSPAARLVIALVALAVIAFAVEGGEWGTLDLVKQHRRMARLARDVDSLTHEVDSLRRYLKAVRTDPVLQEKIAREEFGMVRGTKEILYRFAEPASGDTGRKGGGRKP